MIRRCVMCSYSGTRQEVTGPGKIAQAETLRSHNPALEKDIIVGTMPGKRRQGGLRKQWLDDIIQWTSKVWLR